MFETEKRKADVRLHQHLVVQFDGRPPTPNESNRNIVRQVAWRERREWRATAERVAVAARLEWERRHGLPWRKLDRVVLSVGFSVKDKRRRDLDNLIASTKPLLDGIVDAGIITDDSIDVIQRVEYGAVVNGQTNTVFLIDEVDGSDWTDPKG